MMSTLTTVLVYGIPAAIFLSTLILVILRINPRLMLRSYPQDVQAVVPPQTATEKRQTLYWGIPFWLGLLGIPLTAALAAKTAHLGAFNIFLRTAGVIVLVNVVDWLILDWLIVCTITPRFMVLPGTEGMAGYKNYRMHFRGFLIGTGLGVVIGLLMTVLVVAL